ncbi:MAG: hypothetical protein ACP5RC_10750, partial [Halothiobacillaceae bacterium]
LKVDLQSDLFAYTVDETALARAELGDGKLLLVTTLMVCPNLPIKRIITGRKILSREPWCLCTVITSPPSDRKYLDLFNLLRQPRFDSVDQVMFAPIEFLPLVSFRSASTAGAD